LEGSGFSPLTFPYREARFIKRRKQRNCPSKGYQKEAIYILCVYPQEEKKKKKLLNPEKSLS